MSVRIANLNLDSNPQSGDYLPIDALGTSGTRRTRIKDVIGELNFLHYGGNPNNTSPSTNDAAWTKIIADARATSLPIYFPPGTYQFSNQLDVSSSDTGTISNIYIRGARIPATFLNYVGSTSPFITAGYKGSIPTGLLSLAVYGGELHIENLKIYGGGTNGAVNGMEVYDSTTYLRIRNVQISYFTGGTGLVIQRSYNGSVENSNINFCSRGFLLGSEFNSIGNEWINAFNFNAVRVESCTYTGWSAKVGSVTNTLLNGCTFEGNSGGVIITRCHNTTMLNCYHELNPIPGSGSYITDDYSTQTVIMGNNFLNNVGGNASRAAITVGGGNNNSGSSQSSTLIASNYFSSFRDCVRAGYDSDNDSLPGTLVSPDTITLLNNAYTTVTNRYVPLVSNGTTIVGIEDGKVQGYSPAGVRIYSLGQTGPSSSSIFEQALYLGSANFIGWSGRSNFWSNTNGTFTLSNNGFTDFTSLNFGGNTASFPSIAKSGTELVAQLADQSSLSPFRFKNSQHVYTGTAAGAQTFNLSLADSNRTFTNFGGTGNSNFVLPSTTTSSGFFARFINKSSGNLKVFPAGSSVINVGSGTTSPAGGSLISAGSGDCVTLEWCIDQWMTTSLVGTGWRVG